MPATAGAMTPMGSKALLSVLGFKEWWTTSWAQVMAVPSLMKLKDVAQSAKFYEVCTDPRSTGAFSAHACHAL